MSVLFVHAQQQLPEQVDLQGCIHLELRSCMQGRFSSLSRLPQKVSGMVPSLRSDNSGKSRAANSQAEQYDEDVPARFRSKTLAKFRGRLFGSKNKQPPGTVEIPPSAFDYQSSMSTQPVSLHTSQALLLSTVT